MRSEIWKFARALDYQQVPELHFSIFAVPGLEFKARPALHRAWQVPLTSPCVVTEHSSPWAVRCIFTAHFTQSSSHKRSNEWLTWREIKTTFLLSFLGLFFFFHYFHKRWKWNIKQTPPLLQHYTENYENCQNILCVVQEQRSQVLISGGHKDSLINTHSKCGPIKANTAKDKNYKNQMNLNQLPLFTDKVPSDWVTFLEIMLLIPWEKWFPPATSPAVTHWIITIIMVLI